MKCCYLIYCKDLDIKEVYIGHSDEKKEQIKEWDNVISTCSICGKIYQQKSGLRKHIREKHE